jgi:multidrug efflux pump subunit AcrB
VEIGADDYGTNAYLSGANSNMIAIFQRPGSNALATGLRLRKR